MCSFSIFSFWAPDLQCQQVANAFPSQDGDGRRRVTTSQEFLIKVRRTYFFLVRCEAWRTCMATSGSICSSVFMADVEMLGSGFRAAATILEIPSFMVTPPVTMITASR